MQHFCKKNQKKTNTSIFLIIYCIFVQIYFQFLLNVTEY